MDNVTLWRSTGQNGIVQDLVANRFVTIDVTASGDTQLVAAPGAGVRLRLMHYRITSTGLLAALGGLTCQFKDSSGLLPFSQQFILPAALAANVGSPYSPQVMILGGYPIASNSALSLNASVVLASGTTRVEIGYLFEAG